eukprot:scaffold213573_cov36-Cyclotella_meneghiniana.AAC.2
MPSSLSRRTPTPFEAATDLCFNWGLTIPESELPSRLEAILKANPNIVYQKEEKGGYTLLHNAAQGRSPEFCKLIIEMNPDLVRMPNDYGHDLPFHMACYGANVDTAKYLFHLYPESINLPDVCGYSPLQILLVPREEIAHGYLTGECALELVQFLLQNDQGAISTPKKDHNLLSDDNGFLPLHHACRNRSMAFVKPIFNAYPEAIYIENDYGDTPLDEARNRRKEEVLEFLENQVELERQAREERALDNHGQLPIHQALQNEDTSVGTVKLMMAAHPASAGMADNRGHTPLHIACEVGNLDAIKYLMGIEPDLLKTSDLRGNAPLHLACLGGKCEAIPCILEQSTYGATLQNSDKLTPIELFLVKSDCERDSQEYVEAVRSLLQVDPVEVLKCLGNKRKNTSSV